MMSDSFSNIPKLPDGKIDFSKLYKREDEIDVDQYFSQKELEEMGSYAKKRYKNLKMNYEVMLLMGLPAIKPDFMKGPAYRARLAARRERADYKVPTDSSEDSDEEWTPNMSRKKARVNNPSVAVKKYQQKMNNAYKDTRIVNTRGKKKSEQTSEKIIPYSLRERVSTNFMNLEVPDDDSFLYCEECNKEYDRDCPVHGELTVIKDSETEPNDPDKALHSLPPGLMVKESGIPEAGLGVWATKEFQARVLFGPYGGEIVCNQELAHSSGYAWQIYKDRKPSHFVDAKDESKSNWMRYVNCAASETEQNLVAFQYKGEIYYRSYKCIPSGTELLVWYGQDYARDLGMIRDKNLLLVPKYINGEEIYVCLYCKNAFSTSKYYVRHLLYQHQCDKLDQKDIQLLDSWLRKQETSKCSGDPKKSQLVDSILQCKSQKSDQQIRQEEYTKKEEYHNTLCEQNSSEFDNLHSDEDSFRSDTIPQNHGRKQTDRKSYKCGTCGKAFEVQRHLQVHQRKHTGEKPYKCDTCGKAYTQSGDLKTHQRIHTGEKPYKCNICGKAFARSNMLQTHQGIHTGEKPYKCNICGNAFTRSNILQVHRRIHTGEKPYKCDTCGKAFTQSNNLQVHQRIHTGEKPFKCDTCRKAFARSGDLQKHQKRQTGDKPYKCDTCGKAYTQSGDLKKHQRTHTGEKPYKCDTCGKAFTDHSNLQKHQRTHTGEKPYKCDTCGNTFIQACTLQTHQRIHTGEKPYKCDTCGKAYTQSGDLKKHQRTHTGEKPYKCDTCGNTFIQACTLQTHQRIHTGEKPYKCDTCGKAFTQLAHLQTHQSIHTSENPYKCDTRGKAFAYSSDLQKHLRIHTGEKPHKCDTCGNTFIQACTLQTHQRIHTGEKPYKCDICGKAFSQLAHLQTDQRIHTGENPCGKAFTQSNNLQIHQRIHTGEKPYKSDA